jgi:transposase
MRDLVRARIAAMEAVRRYRQQLQGFLLRHGRIYPGKTHWTKTHIDWIRRLKFEQAAHHYVIEENLTGIRDSHDRQARLEQQIANLLPSWSLAPVVEAIQAMRGISEMSAVILAAEVGDFSRFPHPQQFVSYLGLSPSEHSSGKRVIRGGITKAGSKHARRVLIEGAWAYRLPARVGHKAAARQKGLAKDVLDTAWKAQSRLCHRFRVLCARGKNQNIVATAIAREIACFVWEIAQAVPIASAARRAA